MKGTRRIQPRLKLLALLLSAVMLVSLIPVSSILLQKASAISPAAMYEGSDVYHDNDGHRPASALKAGEVWTDKHVIKDANIAQNYQFDIILKALAGKNETEDVTQYDIIFLLDVSQSMDGYIDGLEDAANDAIEAALSGNTDDVFNRVAVITFGRGADIHKLSGQTWLSELGTNSPISNLKKASQQGTNMQAALYEAYKLLNNENQVRGDATPVIILMSDGAPNCYANPNHPAKINLFQNPPDNLTNTNYIDNVQFPYSRQFDGDNTSAAHTLLYAKWLRAKFSNLKIYTVGFRLAGKNLAKAVVNPSQNTISQASGLASAINNVSLYRPANVYYQNGHYAADEAEDLGKSLKAVVDTITSNIISENLVIEDHVGASYDFVVANNVLEFELDGATPLKQAIDSENTGSFVYEDSDGVSVEFDTVKGKVTYTIPAGKLKTVEPDDDTVNYDNLAIYNSIKFPVVLKNNADVGYHYTNNDQFGAIYDRGNAIEDKEGCTATFTPAEGNPAYQNKAERTNFHGDTGVIKLKAVPPPDVSLELVKQIVGGNPDKEFPFTVTLTAPQGKNLEGVTATLYRYNTSTGQYGDGESVTDWTNGSTIFSLGHLDKVVFLNIPNGTTYTIVETEDSLYAPSYKVSGDWISGAIAQGTLENNTEVAFKNTYLTGSLTVSKHRIGYSPTEKYKFTIAFEFPNEYIAGIAASLTKAGESEPTSLDISDFTQPISVDLADGDTVQFTYLPVGTKFTVTESPDHADVTIFVNDAPLENGSNEVKGEIESGETTILYENDYTDFAPFKVVKKVSAINNPTPPNTFEFDLYLYTLEEVPEAESAPGDELMLQSLDDPTDGPTDKPDGEQGDDPADEPDDEQGDDPADKPDDEQGDDPADKPDDEQGKSAAKAISSEPEPVPYDFPEGQIPDGLQKVEDGHYTFTLTATPTESGALSIYNIPRGTYYKVVERQSENDPKPRYTFIKATPEADIDKENLTVEGQIPNEACKVKVTYLNSYSITPGTLTLRKYFDGPWWRTPYSSIFTVEFDQPDVKLLGIRPMGFEEPVAGLSTGNSIFTDVEVGYWPVTFTNIMPGTTFTITEQVDPDNPPDRISYSATWRIDCNGEPVQDDSTTGKEAYTGSMLSDYAAGHAEIECTNEYDWPDIDVTKLVNGKKSVAVSPGSTVTYTVDIVYPAPYEVSYITFADAMIDDFDLNDITITSVNNDEFPIGAVEWVEDEAGRKAIRIELRQPVLYRLEVDNGDEPNPSDMTNTITVTYDVKFSASQTSSVTNTAHVYAFYGWEGEGASRYDSDTARVSFQTSPPPPPPPPPPSPTPTDPPPTEPPVEPTEPPVEPTEPPEEDGEVLGERDDADIAGVVEKLPQTGGISTSTLLGLLGILLIVSGLITAVSVRFFRRRRQR